MDKQFYYLDGINTSYISNEVDLSRIDSDVQRGVKRLSESAYCKLYGSTQSSLKFALALKDYLPLDKAVEAEMTTDKRGIFQLLVTLDTGHQIEFEGVSGGYFGEGTRGSHDILKLCGFSTDQLTIPFSNKTFRVSKTVLS